jgi:hypothetical protein
VQVSAEERQGGNCLYTAESDVHSLRAFRAISTLGFASRAACCARLA